MILLIFILLISFLLFIYITHILIDAEIIQFLINDNDNYCKNMTIQDIRARHSSDYKEYIKKVVKDGRI